MAKTSAGGLTANEDVRPTANSVGIESDWNRSIDEKVNWIDPSESEM